MKGSLRVYHYPKCSTCVKALSFLRERGIQVEAIDISKSPPSPTEIRSMIERLGTSKPLFNTSGKRYRDGGFSARIPTMSIDDVVNELAADGMLVKRPFLISDSIGLVGFKQGDWSRALGV